MAQSPVEELMAMGYSQQQAKRALEIAGGDLEQAVGFLLMGEQSRAQLTDNFGGQNSSRGSLGFAMGMLAEETSSMPGAFRSAPGSSDKIQELIHMGYSPDAAQDALRIANGDLNQAISYLLMGDSRSGFHINDNHNSVRVEDDAAMAAILQEDELGVAEARAWAPAAANGPESAMYHTTTVRNNADIPRMVVSEAFLRTESAGTFCACMAASKFLSGGVVTAEFLNGILEAGIELFRNQDSPEWDVAKVLKKCGKSHLNIEAIEMEGEPKEGIYMSHDVQHVLGIRKQLALCRNQQPAGWQVLILEVPFFDSWMIALPPKGSKNKFWYIDFYPRSIFRVSGAHARVHSTLLQLEESLEGIFSNLASKAGKDYQHFKLYMIKKEKTQRT